MVRKAHFNYPVQTEQKKHFLTPFPSFARSIGCKSARGWRMGDIYFHWCVVPVALLLLTGNADFSPCFKTWAAAAKLVFSRAVAFCALMEAVAAGCIATDITSRLGKSFGLCPSAGISALFAATTESICAPKEAVVELSMVSLQICACVCFFFCFFFVVVPFVFCDILVACNGIWETVEERMRNVLAAAVCRGALIAPFVFSLCFLFDFDLIFVWQRIVAQLQNGKRSRLRIAKRITSKVDSEFAMSTFRVPFSKFFGSGTFDLDEEGLNF